MCHRFTKLPVPPRIFSPYPLEEEEIDAHRKVFLEPDESKDEVELIRAGHQPALSSSSKGMLFISNTPQKCKVAVTSCFVPDCWTPGNMKQKKSRPTVASSEMCDSVIHPVMYTGSTHCRLRGPVGPHS